MRFWEGFEMTCYSLLASHFSGLMGLTNLEVMDFQRLIWLWERCANERFSVKMTLGPWASWHFTSEQEPIWTFAKIFRRLCCWSGWVTKRSDVFQCTITFSYSFPICPPHYSLCVLSFDLEAMLNKYKMKKSLCNYYRIKSDKHIYSVLLAYSLNKCPTPNLLPHPSSDRRR